MRLLFLVLLVGLLACEGTPSQKTSSKEIAPRLTNQKNQYPEGMPPVYDHFKDLAFLFEQQTDTTYLINFWATWCQPCIEELPHLEALTQKYQEAPLKVILVNTDSKKQLVPKLLPFIKERQLLSKVVVLLDPNEASWIDQIEPNWSGAIPMSLIYNSTKRSFQEGAFESLEELEAWVKPFLL